jgi:hypothetical protein
MLWLKACPQCCGDLVEQRDFLGRHLGCVECGFIYVGLPREVKTLMDDVLAGLAEEAPKQTTRVGQAPKEPVLIGT